MNMRTPRPWSHRNGRIFQTDYDVLTIANVARAHDGDYSPSNGDLLAAAPELLDMLERAVRRLEIAHANGDSIMREWIVDARAVIAKAKGETK